MFDQKLTSSGLLNQISNPEESIQKPLIHQWNFFQRSDFSPNHSFPVQTFGSFHSFFIPQLDQSRQSEARLGDDLLINKDQFNYNEDQSPFFVMPYHRGTSEVPDVKQAAPSMAMQSYQMGLQQLKEKQEASLEQHPLSNTQMDFPNHLSKQELPLTSNISQNTSALTKQKTLVNHKKGYLAKNVTKNLGKLLIKYIWKNKKYLSQKLRVNPQQWQQFIEKVQVWKKENNITREFLITKWQGEESESKIFRTLSLYFFRQQCLPSIMESNIREKKIHIERIPKFSAAILDPKVLDYLS